MESQYAKVKIAAAHRWVAPGHIFLFYFIVCCSIIFKITNENKMKSVLSPSSMFISQLLV